RADRGGGARRGRRRGRRCGRRGGRGRRRRRGGARPVQSADDLRDAVVDERFDRRRVVERLAVVAALVLELLEAALRRVGAAVELGLHLVDAPLGVRIGGLAGRLRELLALEETGDLAGDALLLGHAALALRRRSRVDRADQLRDAGVDLRFD